MRVRWAQDARSSQEVSWGVIIIIVYRCRDAIGVDGARAPRMRV